MISATRRQLATLRSLATRKGRRETGWFPVEGVRLCRELAESSLDVPMVLVSEEQAETPEVREIAARLAQRGSVQLCAPARQVERVSDTVHSQGIVAAAEWREVAPEEIELSQTTRLLALDGISDPGNVGTIIRTADWFGVGAVLLGDGCADPLNPKTVRATMGGLFHLPICRQLDLPDTLMRIKEKGFQIIAAGLGGDTGWRSPRPTSRLCLLLGSEAHGLAPEVEQVADRTVTIPGRGSGDSLNVAVAAGILLSALQDVGPE